MDRKRSIQDRSALEHEAHILDIAYPQITEIDGLRIENAAGVFRPEPDGSTVLLGQTINNLPTIPGLRALDMGCGSGLLAIQMARRGMTVMATDKDPRCVAVTLRNARRNDATLEARCGSLWEPVAGERPFDLVVADLPLWDKPVESPGEVSLCDPGGTLLLGFLAGLPRHLATYGQAVITHSNASLPLPESWAGRCRVLAQKTRTHGFVIQVVRLA